MRKLLQKIALLFAVAVLAAISVSGQRQMENLDRGLVAVKVSSGVFLSWRVLGTEWSGVSYNLYRGSTLLNSSPITGATNYTDAAGTTSSTYYVKAVVGGVEQAASPTIGVWASNYLDIPLQIPAGLTMPDGTTCTYNANDCSVGDVNGDGKYEIILKWDPSNSKDNSQSGYTGNVYLDAYTLSGTRLWRIDLGKNIRAGAHYTQFLVYDFDGDGKAEIVCKTAPGTKDGTGNYLSGAAAGTDNNADYRNSSGYILTGPEYLTIFNGQTGKELQTINYEVARGTVSSWGDSYGNRVDRFLACVAYLDGKTPSIVMCRGYYTRCYLVAYKWSGSSLTKQWAFDSNSSGNSGYAGQGCHSLCVGDVDGDGFDEIVYGACTIDHNGAGKYTTGLGHGDALHLGDFNPDRAGLEVWQAHESGSGATFRDANTGSVIWKFASSGDVGRGMAADVSSGTKGVECWAAGSGLYSCTGSTVSSSAPSSDNFGIWWDGDDQRELLDGTSITKYGGSTLLSASGCSSNNSTKSNPCLSADILGDWREEAIWRTSDNTKLRIFTTTTTTSRRLYTLMHDPIYRLGIAWQNVAYNQPPDVSFYLGGGMGTPPTPNITLVGGTTCTPTAITPYIQVNGGTLQQISSATVSSGATVLLSPQPASGGSWSWTGCGTSGTAREQTIYPTSSCTSTATYTNSCGAQSTQSFAITVSGSTSTTVTIQENTTGFCSVDGTVDSNNAGYTGTGFANSNNATAAGITWSVNVPSTGTYTLKWRYANGTTTDRPGVLKVDGTTVIASISLPGTGAWTTWVETSGTNVSLAAGNRLIRLEATTANGLSNIDYISVTGINPVPVSCTGLKSAPEISIGDETMDFNLSPNPVNGLLTIRFNSELSGASVLQLFNSTGRLILTNKIQGSIHMLDMGNLPSGIYLVKITSSNNTVIKRVVKQ